MRPRNNPDLRSDAVLIFWYKTYATLLKENRKILFLTHQRLRWLKTTIAIALLCALALSWRLWISSRLFPLSPVGDFLPRIPYPFDYIWLFLLLVLLPAIIVIAQPRRVILTFLVLAGALALWDQARWQPWFYQYFFLLAAIGLYAGKKPNAANQQAALNACRLIVVCTYLWSGLRLRSPGDQWIAINAALGLPKLPQMTKLQSAE